jgi:hypothetical protein
MAVPSLNLSLVRERATGSLYQPAPLLVMTIAEGVNIFRRQLWEISDQPLIEKAHVLSPACGDEFL